jgi:hypothetical protein
MDDHKRRALLKGLLNISGSATGARPVELTVVVQSEVRPWRFPDGRLPSQMPAWPR